MAIGPSIPRKKPASPPPGPVPVERRKHDPALEERHKTHAPKPVPKHVFRSIGLGLITGAADDDPVAIGTYAAAGAKFGPAVLWLAPVAMPMMFAVVYLSSKIGQVTGRGLFAVMRQHYSRWLVLAFLATMLIGNTIEAGADIGGMATALHLVVPIPPAVIVVLVTMSVLALQIWGSYTSIRDIFRWLALALLAYLASALLAHPGWSETLKATLVPHVRMDRGFLEIVVAVIGSSLSAYLYTWQSNQEVEEDISMGRRRLIDRMGTTKAELSHSRHDVALGMFVSSLVMYSIILSTGATLFRAGKFDINTAAEAALALRPLAGKFAELLFTIGLFGVGFVAVPVMTAGAAYDFCQTFHVKHGLHTPPRQARGFYAVIAVVTAVAMGMNFLGINPMKALVWAGIVQGLSTPFLMLLLMRMTNNRRIMGRWVNTPVLNILGWITTSAIFAATAGLIYFWIR